MTAVIWPCLRLDLCLMTAVIGACRPRVLEWRMTTYAGGATGATLAAGSALTAWMLAPLAVGVWLMHRRDV